MDLYIYYRVPAADAALVQAKVKQMQASLADQYGISTALKRRPAEQDGMHTWMEVYLAVADDTAEDFTAALELAVAANQLSSLIDGKRHTEQFLDLSLCV